MHPVLGCPRLRYASDNSRGLPFRGMNSVRGEVGGGWWLPSGHGRVRCEDAAATWEVGGVPRRVERGRRHRGVRVGVGDGPLLPTHAAARRDASRELDDARRAGDGDPSATARLHGERHALPPPGGDGERRRDDRPHLGWPFRPRPRRRMVRAGVERLRHPARHADRAVRPIRRGCRGDLLTAQQRGHQLLRPLLRAHRRPLQPEACPTPPSHRHRRQGTQAHIANRGSVGRPLGHRCDRRRCSGSA